MRRDPDQKVRRRRVFYFPGYDPIHSRRYRELYRKESTEQAQISGYRIEQRPKDGHDGIYGWQVAADFDGARVRSDIDVLVWSDIVRNSMSNTIPATYAHLVRVCWTYITTGTLRRLMRLRKGPVIAALYPVVMLILQLLLGLLLAWGVSRVAIGLAQAVLPTWTWLHSVIWIAAVAGGLALGARAMRWFRDHDHLIYVYYLLHNYAFSARHAGATPPELDARLKEFTEIIARALTDKVDEVLIVGHSSGAHLAVSVVADLLRNRQVPANGPALSLLTLGQVVPMVSFLPKAIGLRSDLRDLSVSDQITWVDVTAPGDGCTFALCDPVTVSGVAPEGKRWPLVISAAFTQTLSPERWKAMRWRFFRLHFQYLCAFDRPGDYDYFKITAGPLTLGQRYDGRQPSRSRIDVPVSKYTSVRAA